MKESLKYGLLTSLGYCAIVGVIHLVGLCIGYIAGSIDNFLYSSRLYLYFAVAGLCGSFICGFLYPVILSRYVSRYMSEYPDVPTHYIKEISRGKLLSNYYHIIALVCIICGVGLLHSIDRFPCWCAFFCLAGLYSFACISKNINAIRIFRNNYIGSINNFTYE